MSIGEAIALGGRNNAGRIQGLSMNGDSNGFLVGPSVERWEGMEMGTAVGGCLLTCRICGRSFRRST